MSPRIFVPTRTKNDVIIIYRNSNFSASDNPQFFEKGSGIDKISQVMGKTRISILCKLFNSGLNSVIVATHAQQSVATTIATTTPTKSNVSVAAKSLLLIDAANCAKCCCISISSISSPNFALAPIKALCGADVTTPGLKAKLNNLGLSLKENTQPQFPITVSSLSSLSSKALIGNPAPVCRSFQRK